MKLTPDQIKSANRAAKHYGTNRATDIVVCSGTLADTRSDRRKLHRDGDGDTYPVLPRVLNYDGYHAESRTGIRASMAALKRFWSTYHYVASYCKVEVADHDAIYSNDNH